MINGSYITNLNEIRSSDSHNILTNNPIIPYFENLEQHLIKYIENATYIIGCSAWLTNRNIIEALSSTKGVKLIINKEEYLNSDMEIGKKFHYKCLRGKYNEIPDLFDTKCSHCNKLIYGCQNFIDQIGNFADTNTNTDKKGAILTCGIVNSRTKMHHKFLIFFDDSIKPIGVWTGSYNTSNLSNFSLENALYITDERVIAEYTKEFAIIYKFSEEYNWNKGILCEPL